MRKVFLLFLIELCTFIPTVTNAQISYNDIELTTSRFLGYKTGFGLTSVKSYKVVEGKTSGLNIKEAKPVFKFQFGHLLTLFSVLLHL